MSNPIQDLAFAYHDAMFNRFDDIVYQDRDWTKYNEDRRSSIAATQESMVTKRRKPTSHETTLTVMFPQMWGSTALGFGGGGGNAITMAYSIVIECQGDYAVYFGSKFAYLVRGSKRALFLDIEVMQLASVIDAATRYA